VRVETDEDVEVVGAAGCHYVQVKTRSALLVFSDIESALTRFETIRQAHASGARQGGASFVIASNVASGPELTRRLADPSWPADVAIHWPGANTLIPPGLTLPWPDVEAALVAVSASAASLPFAKLAGDTLAWKLAGCIQAAAAGLPPRANHSFAAAELTVLFEQLVVQLHDFPAPPPLYRPQADEPPLLSPERVRVITGFSGAGKTSWVSQAALHTAGDVFYFNVGDTPSTALVSTVSRELAGHLYGGKGSRLGEIVLPGATSGEILLAINRELASQSVIRNFTEHSANERTFLAWIRTGIAVIAFGFVVEKFNLFILALTATAGAEVGRTIRTDRLAGPLGRYEGLALMLVGIALIVVAGVRFVRTTRLLDAAEPQGGGGVRTEVTITIVLVLLVAAYGLSIAVR
jgi:uncharacterized membrane protein YidH (DUF202 family)